MNWETLTQIYEEERQKLTDNGWQQRSTAAFWSVQGDPAAGVDEGDKGWWRRISGALEHCEEEEEGEKAKGGEWKEDM